MATTPTIDDLLAANARTTPGGRCSVGGALSTLDPATATKLAAALADRKGYAASGLVVIFAGLGERVGRSSVERHRRLDCNCGR